MTKSVEIFSGTIKSILKSVALGGVAFYLLHSYFDLSALSSHDTLSIFRSMGSTLSQISITLAGFILTSTAIFTAFGDKPLIQAMYISGHASALIARMYIAITISIITCISALYLVVIPNPKEFFFFLTISLAFSCLYSLSSVMFKLWYVLHYISPTPPTSDDSEYEDINHEAKPVPQKN